MKIKIILIKVFILPKILITRPMYLLGTLSKRKEFRNILTPEFDNPRKTDTNNNEKIYLLLIRIKIDKLVKSINIIVNRILLICCNHLYIKAPEINAPKA